MRKALMTAILLAVTIPAFASSQQCPVDGGNCTGDGYTPIPPKVIIIWHKAQRFFFRYRR